MTLCKSAQRQFAFILALASASIHSGCKGDPALECPVDVGAVAAEDGGPIGTPGPADGSTGKQDAGSAIGTQDAGQPDASAATDSGVPAQGCFESMRPGRLAACVVPFGGLTVAPQASGSIKHSVSIAGSKADGPSSGFPPDGCFSPTRVLPEGEPVSFGLAELFFGPERRFMTVDANYRWLAIRDDSGGNKHWTVAYVFETQTAPIDIYSAIHVTHRVTMQDAIASGDFTIEDSKGVVLHVVMNPPEFSGGSPAWATSLQETANLPFTITRGNLACSDTIDGVTVEVYDLVVSSPGATDTIVPHGTTVKVDGYYVMNAQSYQARDMENPPFRWLAGFMRAD